MKTIRQIANELGVSKQAVYKRIKGSLYTVVAPYTHTVDGIVYISEQGERLVIQAFCKNTAYKGAHTEYTEAHTEYTENHTNGSEVLFLRNQNKTLLEDLEKERAHSRGQADKLSDLAAQLAELTRNNQVLLGAEQSRTNPALLLGSDEVVRLNFKKRIKVLFTGKS